MAKDNASDFDLDDILSGDYASDETFSLESILSEYKGRAFIEGERKTPSHELDDKVNEILGSAGVKPAREKITDFDTFLREAAAGKVSSEAANEPKAEEKPAPVVEKPAPVAEKPAPVVEKPAPVVEKPAPVAEKPAPVVEKPAPAPEAKPAEPVADDNDPDFFFDRLSEPSRRFGSDRLADLFSDDSSSFEEPEVAGELDLFDPEPEEEDDQDTEERPSFFDRIRARFSKKDNAEPEPEEEEEEWPEPEPEPEPDYEQEAERFARPVPLLSVRSIIAFLVVVLMAVVTFMYENGVELPLGIGSNPVAVQGILLLLQLFVIALGIDILIAGISDLIHADPGADSLVFISTLFTVADGFLILGFRNFDNGLSFALVSAASVFFAMRGKRAHLTGYVNALKVAQGSANPYSVISVTDRDSDPIRSVLKKVRGVSGGYYSKLVSRDISELAYSYATPIFVLAAFLFALIATVARGRSADFTHSIAIMASVLAAFPAASAFALPFMYASAKLRKSGSAVSGWGGACDIYDTDGAVISDEDVFPAGSISLSGVKFFTGFSNQKAISYGASLLVASDTGLSRVFAELLRSQGLPVKKVSEFQTHEGGGVEGVIEGARVICGSGAFMNLMGIRVPDKVNTVNAVFTAVNGTLAAVFTVNYVPANSVSTSLRSLLNTKVNVMFAVRDFNVTPAVIRQKFRVSMDGVEYLPAETSYKLSRLTKDDAGGISAILCRDGLSPFAEVITKGRRIKLITELNTIASIGGTAVGLLLMFFLCATGAYSAASSGHAFILMMAIEVFVFIISQFVRKRN